MGNITKELIEEVEQLQARIKKLESKNRALQIQLTETQEERDRWKQRVHAIS